MPDQIWWELVRTSIGSMIKTYLVSMKWLNKCFTPELRHQPEENSREHVYHVRATWAPTHVHTVPINLSTTTQANNLNLLVVTKETQANNLNLLVVTPWLPRLPGKGVRHIFYSSNPWQSLWRQHAPSHVASCFSNIHWHFYSYLIE